MAKGKKGANKTASPPSVDPRSAPVLLPDIEDLNPMTGKTHSHRSTDSQETRVIAAARHSAESWRQYAPTYTVADVKLSELELRPKNTKPDIKAANTIIATMADHEADSCSGRFVDEDGMTLVCVFAKRPVVCTQKQGKKRKSQKPPVYESSAGRTAEDLKKMPQNEIYWDGLPVNALERYHEATQVLHSKQPPCANKRDIRHPDEKVMSYNIVTKKDPRTAGLEEANEGHPMEVDQEEPASMPEVEESPETEYVREGLGSAATIGRERTGTTHLVHAWHQQGHPNGVMTLSRDMHGRTVTGAMFVRYYFRASRAVALHLRECFRVAFPEYFEKYKVAFEAGVWETEDPGPWLGRAIVWKLPVKTHMDGLDEGPAAIFNHGNYEGGDLYIPDLKLKLSYRPGDVVILLAGRLYHSVSEWKPGAQSLNDKLSPGRIGNVFFFPKLSFEKLKDKPPFWHVNTCSGQLPSSDESKPL